MSEFHEGQVIEFSYPFVRGMYTHYDEDGSSKAPTWRPGVRYEPVSPEDSEAVADAIGKQIVTVVSVHKPGRFPERVFYTRQWQSPIGHKFGKPALRITTTYNLRKLIRGYRHEFRLTQKTAA